MGILKPRTNLMKEDSGTDSVGSTDRSVAPTRWPRHRNRDEVGGGVSSNVHTAWSRNDLHLDPVHDLPSQSPQGDPSIDDPVNDSGLATRCGDLEVSGEFAS